MSWYKIGTVAVTNGSNIVQGTGTAWIANVSIGEEFRLEGGQVGYEITDISSNNTMTIAPAFLGATASAQAYVIVPVRGFARRVIDAMVTARASIETHLTKALAGRFPSGTEGSPGIAFENETSLGLYRDGAKTLGVSTNSTRRIKVSDTEVEIALPVTGTAVQSSELDGTTGRLLKVGGFGLGLSSTGLPAPGNDFDALRTTGIYRFDNDTVGKPPVNGFTAGMALHMVRVGVDGTGNNLQLAFTHGGLLMHRHMADIDGSWNAWSTISDKVIANANGTAVQFGDGTLLCTHALTVEQTTSARGSLYRSANTTSWTFPAGFVAAPFVEATPYGATNNAWCTSYTPDATGAELTAYRATSQTGSITVRAVAIGRWK